MGNLAIGDKRGWGWGFANWRIFALSIFTLYIPSLLFFAFCGYAGYQFLTEQAAQTQLQRASCSNSTSVGDIVGELFQPAHLIALGIFALIFVLIVRGVIGGSKAFVKAVSKPSRHPDPRRESLRRIGAGPGAHTVLFAG